MAGKAQLKFLMASKPAQQDNTTNPNPNPNPFQKKKKGNLPPGLRDAAKRKLQKMNSGKKNGNN